jgi:lipopolysaccharide/colanic/teichoic acid biosynthesis glycosyltransferase
MYLAFKRSLDVVLAAAILVATAPVLLVAIAAVYLTMGRPVFFQQIRPGRNETPFTLVKLRTMRTRSGASDESDAERLTRLGRWLRRTSIDELPSLVHVLSGTMSLVGPRPLLMRYLPHYTDRERIRHTVRPGLTGWAQIHGRNHVGWDERLAMDAWYVENRSLALDLRILWHTVQRVLSGDGVVDAPATQQPDFDVWRGGVTRWDMDPEEISQGDIVRGGVVRGGIVRDAADRPTS